MERQGTSRALWVILTILLVLALGGTPLQAGTGTAPCEWQRGDPHKMHWPQLPDLSATGIDISLSRGMLADDFKCTGTGPIRDIHIWGSFLEDILPPNGPGSLTLELSIYSDIPATTDRWSRPGTLLWQRTFKPGEYIASRVHEGPEDWYDPAANQYLPGNHKQAYQYDFCIDLDPFVQQEGTIYWLAVREIRTSTTNYAFGWKTASPQYRWNDDATYLGSAGTVSTGWARMTYPKGHSLEGQTLDLAFVITGGKDEGRHRVDLGDAPDNSNSVGAAMSTYPSNVAARFPTVYLAGSPPHGPLHLQPRDMFFLGKWVSLETEADIGPDEDVVNNLDPLANVANRDSVDDGLKLPIAMPSCQTTTLDYIVTVAAAAPVPAYVNVWCDWNRDGDWDDKLVCPDGDEVPEWIVQNDQPLLPGPGTYAFTSPPFESWHPAGGATDPLWLRITIAEQPWQPILGGPAVGGAGPAGGYKYGETEDYYIRYHDEPLPVKYDWGDAPDGVAAPGYPTLAANNGARHVPVGPWLGDTADMPDSEADGQPDLSALGDDTNGSDDENGASIPPLVQGESAVATVEVNGGGGVLQAWIDFDADQVWESAEKIFDGFLADGIHLLAFTVPATAPPGQTFARLRISTTGGLDPNGPALDGEVEDQVVLIEEPVKNEKWCQLPDLTPHGIDIRVDNSDGKRRALADDFECRSTSRLVHIRFWGSWNDDHKGTIKRIHVRIHPDDPVGPGGSDKKNKFSVPAPEILWEKDFFAGGFKEALYHVVHIGGEWWWDPATGKYLPGGDTQVWQIDLDIDPAEAFLQEGTPTKPQIYWLAIEVDASDGEFGWKTRRWPEHFMDDAVWDVGLLLPRTWDELRYPPGHRYADHEKNSVDLSFCLWFAPAPPPPPTILPGAVTQCPAVATACAAVVTTCPPVQTKCPPKQTWCPPVQTKCRPAPTVCQLGQTQCPPVETRCPVTETKCPVVQTRCPPVFTRCPPTETQCQIVETQCPALFTRCPPIATLCQTGETRCPPVETRCPVAETRCPAFETRCPPALTRCPPTTTECQIAETQCPTVETRCPPVQTKCPAFETRCPPILTRCPPTLTECLVAETQCPPIETHCPPAETRCPVVLTECPDLLTRCPPAPTFCQTIETQCPTVETRCPPIETRCPPAKTQCPVVLTLCPPTQTRCPTTPTLCQTIETECPVIETRCPPARTQCPPVLTQCPPTVTLCTGRFTQCVICLPLTQTTDAAGDVVLTTSCPIVETACVTVIDYLTVARAGG